MIKRKKKFSKKKLPDIIYKNNNYHQSTYTGLSKILFYINHKLLDLNLDKKYNENIIEIGGGAEPHIHYMNTKGIKSYTIVDDKSFYKKVIMLKKKYKKIKFNFIDYKKINLIKKRNFFSRIIASHSFEHFQFFEEDFLKLLKFLKNDGIVSIALPCDPGLFWRLLQYFSYFNQKKYYGWKTMLEKDLGDAREHLTSCQSILKIVRIYFKKTKNFFFPFFFLPLIELNIFLIIHVKIKNFNYSN